MNAPSAARSTDDPGEPLREESGWFGFQAINPLAKAYLVRGVFESVASRYDLMNDLMSGGIHRLWKRTMVDWLAPRPGLALLDVAGGTGDIAFRVHDRVKGQADLLVVDATPAMLEVGRDRAIDRGLLSQIRWTAGNAERLPVRSQSYDAVTIAFGLRNVTVLDRALAEMRRVLKPGGRFLCLEFSTVVVPLLDRLYELYSFNVLPLLGAAVVGDRASYQYLVESIRKFPAQEELAERMRKAGLEQVKVRNLSGGIAALHSAWRL